MTHEDFGKILETLHEAFTDISKDGSNPHNWKEIRRLQHEAIDALKKSGNWNEKTAKAIHKYDHHWFSRMKANVETYMQPMQELFKEITSPSKEKRKQRTRENKDKLTNPEKVRWDRYNIRGSSRCKEDSPQETI
jgi:primosomal protein N''